MGHLFSDSFYIIAWSFSFVKAFFDFSLDNISAV